MATWITVVDAFRWAWILRPGAGAGQVSDSERGWGADRSRGQSMIEYALIFLLVVLGLILVLVFLGPQIASEYRNVENNL